MNCKEIVISMFCAGFMDSIFRTWGCFINNFYTFPPIIRPKKHFLMNRVHQKVDKPIKCWLIHISLLVSLSMPLWKYGTESVWHQVALSRKLFNNFDQKLSSVAQRTFRNIWGQKLWCRLGSRFLCRMFVGSAVRSDTCRGREGRRSGQWEKQGCNAVMTKPWSHGELRAWDGPVHAIPGNQTFIPLNWSVTECGLPWEAGILEQGGALQWRWSSKRAEETPQQTTFPAAEEMHPSAWSRDFGQCSPASITQSKHQHVWCPFLWAPEFGLLCFAERANSIRQRTVWRSHISRTWFLWKSEMYHTAFP